MKVFNTAEDESVVSVTRLRDEDDEGDGDDEADLEPNDGEDAVEA